MTGPALAAFLLEDAGTVGTIAAVVAGTLAAASFILQLWLRANRGRVALARERLALHQQQVDHDLETGRKMSEFEQEDQIRPSDPQARAWAAEREGAVFEKTGDAIAEVQLRLAWQELSIESESAKLPRYMPISIYAERNDATEYYEIRDAIESLLAEFGFEIASEGRLEKGSLFQRMTAKLKDPATKAELKRQAALAHLALQQETLGRAQSEINAKQAEAAAVVHKILSEHDRHVIVIGSLVGVTERDATGSRNSMIVELTPDQLAAFYRDGNALQNAKRAFELLSAMEPTQATQQSSRLSLPGGGDRELSRGDSPPGLPPGG